MRVQSPVGEFPVSPTGIGLANGVPCVDVSMGAWRSRVSFTREDLSLLALVTAVLLLVFFAGRRSRQGES